MKYRKESLIFGGFFLGVSLATSTVVLASPRFIIDFNTDRKGGDYRRFKTNSMETCLRSCANESDCKSFTYVPPGAQPGQNNNQGICWLKNQVSRASANYGGMISGVKQ